jgi:hypothetical protein
MPYQLSIDLYTFAAPLSSEATLLGLESAKDFETAGYEPVSIRV